ncbi:hypothetical protein ACX0HA_08840 [Flavobacterium hauense]
MKKYFITVAATYVTKNKLQEIILEKSKSLAFTLCDSMDQAKAAVDKLFTDAVAEYKGSAKEQAPDYNYYLQFIGGKEFEVINVTVTSCLLLSLKPVLSANSNTMISTEIQRKIDRYDQLDAYLKKAYAEEEVDEDSEDDFGNDFNLLSIGEEAATIFGYLS